MTHAAPLHITDIHNSDNKKLVTDNVSIPKMEFTLSSPTYEVVCIIPWNFVRNPF